ncbi:acetolactate synthase 3 large subunit, partial [Erwinia amylovora]|nr:acetolactate synthase 3 large subunit [Erwinia amylovora]
NLAKYCPNATVLHIEIEPTSISKTIAAEVPNVGEARQVLQQMLELLAQNEARQDFDALRDWWQSIEPWRSRQCLAFYPCSDNIKPKSVSETICR